MNTRTMSSFGALAFGAIVLSSCMTYDEQLAFNGVNTDRGAAHVNSLQPEPYLVAKAQAWAQHLLDESGDSCTKDDIEHSHLPDGAPPNWTKLGENVGCTIVSGADEPLDTLQKAFMASPGHRANITDATFTVGGVGVVSKPLGGGATLVWEVQEFAVVR